MYAEWSHYLCHRGSDDEAGLKQVLALPSFMDEERRALVNRASGSDPNPAPADELEETTTDARLVEGGCDKF